MRSGPVPSTRFGLVMESTSKNRFASGVVVHSVKSLAVFGFFAFLRTHVNTYELAVRSLKKPYADRRFRIFSFDLEDIFAIGRQEFELTQQHPLNARFVRHDRGIQRAPAPHNLHPSCPWIDQRAELGVGHERREGKHAPVYFGLPKSAIV